MTAPAKATITGKCSACINGKHEGCGYPFVACECYCVKKYDPEPTRD